MDACASAAVHGAGRRARPRADALPPTDVDFRADVRPPGGRLRSTALRSDPQPPQAGPLHPDDTDGATTASARHRGPPAAARHHLEPPPSKPERSAKHARSDTCTISLAPAQLGHRNHAEGGGDGSAGAPQLATPHPDIDTGLCSTPGCTRRARVHARPVLPRLCPSPPPRRCAVSHPRLRRGAS